MLTAPKPKPMASAGMNPVRLTSQLRNKAPMVPASCERRAHQDRVLLGISRVGDQRGEPVRQEIEIQQVHEVDHPQRYRAQGAAFMEQVDEGDAFAGLFGCDQLCVVADLCGGVEAAGPTAGAFSMALRCRAAKGSDSGRKKIIATPMTSGIIPPK